MRRAVVVSYARTGLAKSGRGGFNDLQVGKAHDDHAGIAVWRIFISRNIGPGDEAHRSQPVVPVHLVDQSLLEGDGFFGAERPGMQRSNLHGEGRSVASHDRRSAGVKSTD